MRLQQVLYVEKRVLSIRLKVSASLTEGSTVQVTDLQLQAGEQATGVVPNPAEAGSNLGGTQYRNGVVGGDMNVVVLANLDRTAPAELTVKNASGETRVGSYRFGKFTGSATVDGLNQTATRGYGRPPVIPERSDARFPASVEGRVHLRMNWTDRRP